MNRKLSYCKDNQCPHCPQCKFIMDLDDVDYNFKGNQNEYWCCPNYDCDISAFVKVRYGRVISVEFINELGKTIKTIKYNELDGGEFDE